MENKITRRCPECEERLTRRELLQAAGGAVAATAAGVVASSFPAYATPRLPQAAQAAKAALKGTPESLVKTLYYTLTDDQKRLICLPWENQKRAMVNANWAIVDPTIGKAFTADQQDLVRAIFKGVTNEEWYGKFLTQMKNDGGGFENYHVAIFGDPDTGKSEFVMTGRHMTMRAGGDPSANMAFGGPIFYGHAPKDTEDPSHPGNVFWYQAKRANEVFQMLDGKQREKALIALAPDESAVSFRKPGQPVPGVPVGTLSRDQKEHVHKVMHDVLAPYRKSDVEEALQNIKENGGFDALHLSFYKQDDLGNDGVWDIWRLEGPGLVWHFRGSPHVHTWVNIAGKQK
jgi:hypothetical protein